MKIGTGVAAVALALVLAACGSSAKTSSSTPVAATNSTVPSTTSTTTTAPAKKAAKPKKKRKAAHTQTTTTSTTTTPSTTTTTTSTTHHTTTTPAAPALAPLPSPYVSGSSGQMRAELHGENHAPKIGVKWEYQVEATNAQGQPLKGTVLTQFVYNGSVVGHQSPPSLPLKNGKLIYKNTFPPASKGIGLTFEVVVSTSLGKVTLNWPVKSHT